MKYKTLAYLGLSLSVLSAVPIPAIAQTTSATVATPPKIAALDTYFSRFVRPNEPGIIVLVMKKGKVVHFSSHGFANVERRTPFTMDTAMHIGSTGKQFTAIAILLLVQSGAIDLDAPVSRYLSEFRGLDDRVTVRSLLNHTSGLNTYYPDEDPDQVGWKKLQDMVVKEGMGVPTGSQAARVLADMPLKFEPGTQWDYSNTAFEVAGTVVERVSGQSYPSFLQNRIFKPLGMTGAFALPNAARQNAATTAQSYEAVDGKENRRLGRVNRNRLDLRYLDGLSGAGTIFMTANDMVKYEAAWRANFPLLKEPQLIEMLRATGPARAEAYGLGVYLGFPTVTEPDVKGKLAALGPDIVTHAGEWPAYNTEYARFVSSDITVFTSLNRDYLFDDVGVIRNIPRAEVDKLPDELFFGSTAKMQIDVADIVRRMP
jgi:CubicO group peptidase (beta-lactamase class C family)